MPNPPSREGWTEPSQRVQGIVVQLIVNEALSEPEALTRCEQEAKQVAAPYREAAVLIRKSLGEPDEVVLRLPRDKAEQLFDVLDRFCALIPDGVLTRESHDIEGTMIALRRAISEHST